MCVYDEQGADMLREHEVLVRSSHHYQASAGESATTTQGTTRSLERFRTVAQVKKLT